MSAFQPEQVKQWAESLDRVDYYRVLGLPRPPPTHPHGDDVLRQAFLKAASSFHPDRYKTCDETTRKYADTIFRRVNEAYRVLRHPQLRQRYHVVLGSNGLRLPPAEVAALSSSRIPAANVSAAPGDAAANAASSSSMSAARPVSIEALIENPASIHFAREADRAMARGDVQSAKLQMQLILAKEPTNRRILQHLQSYSSPRLPKA